MKMCQCSACAIEGFESIYSVLLMTQHLTAIMTFIVQIDFGALSVGVCESVDGLN